MQLKLLFALIFMEMAMIVAFFFITPLRKLVIMGIDRAKRGRGPVVAKTVAVTMFAVMMTTLYSAVAIRRRWLQDGEVSPTDQILFSRNLLETSLMGFSLFLALMINRLHHYMRELRIKRKSVESVKKQNRVFDDSKPPVISEEIKALQEETATLQGRIKQLEAEIYEKSKEASNAQDNAEALKKQSEGFLLEYGRLLEENQTLRSQLLSLEHRITSFS